MNYGVLLFVILFGFFSATLQAEQKVPAEVKGVVDRAKGCLHWSGETGDTDPARTAQIMRAVKELRCDALKADAQRIWKKYSRNNASRKAFEIANSNWETGMGEPLIEGVHH